MKINISRLDDTVKLDVQGGHESQGDDREEDSHCNREDKEHANELYEGGRKEKQKSLKKKTKKGVKHSQLKSPA